MSILFLLTFHLKRILAFALIHFFFKYEKSRMFKSKIELKKLSMPCYERILFCFVEISTTKSMELLWVQL